jgi:hypothetical protein
MNTPRRVPGFPPPEQLAEPADEKPVVHDGAPAIDRRAAVKPLNVRIALPLLQRYQQLVRDLNDAGYATSLAELMHALMLPGPNTAAEARALIRDWRRATDPDR